MHNGGVPSIKEVAVPLPNGNTVPQHQCHAWSRWHKHCVNDYTVASIKAMPSRGPNGKETFTYPTSALTQGGADYSKQK